MNERIRQLAEQAEFFERDLLIQGDNFQRFAELIVRECLDIVNRHEYSYHEADPLWETAQLIKEHFGVES
jgi:predicted lipid carrier protein YhbT